MRATQTEPSGGGARVFATGLVAYGVACLAGALTWVMLAMGARMSLEALAALPLILLVVSVTALPGFLALRLALAAWRRTGVAWFAAAGLVNGVMVTLVIALGSGHDIGRNDAVVIAAAGILGLVTGATYRWVERGLQRMPQDGA